MLICHLIFMFVLSLYLYVDVCGCVLCECMRASLSLFLSSLFSLLRPLLQPPLSLSLLLCHMRVLSGALLSAGLCEFTHYDCV